MPKKKQKAEKSGRIVGVAEVLFIIGAAGVSYGSWVVYNPAGFIVAGSLFLITGYLVARVRNIG